MGVLRDYFELTKPRLSSLVLVSAAVGMLLCPAGPPALATAILILAGTAVVVGGANACNAYYERDLDARMTRTRTRPLPAGRLEPIRAFWFGAVLGLVGMGMLWTVQPLAAVLSLVAFVSYVWIYTPLKRRTPLCTLVGAVPGALPPVIGWTAVSGALDPGAWVLFAWLFLWQPPHFFALAFLYEEDYRLAGMPMLPVVHGRGGLVERLMLVSTVLLLPLPMLLVPWSRAGTLSLVALPILGLGFLIVVAREWRRGTTEATARASFAASIAYLGLAFAALLFDGAVAG